MLTRPDEVREYLARGWSFDTFPSADPTVATIRTWIHAPFTTDPGLLVWGGVGRGKTGLAATCPRQFLLADTTRTALFGRLTPVREELAGGTGNVLAAWLAAVDLLMLDDLDFGWAGTRAGDAGAIVLAERRRTRLPRNRPVLLTAHVPPAGLAERVDPNLQTVFADWGGPSRRSPKDGASRTGRLW